jgi:hypothetical protein
VIVLLAIPATFVGQLVEPYRIPFGPVEVEAVAGPLELEQDIRAAASLADLEPLP